MFGQSGRLKFSQLIDGPKWIMTFGVLVLVNLSSFAAVSPPVSDTYYVNDNSTTGDAYTTAVGDDANAGTAAAPFATINYAISQASSGDIIYVDAGTYSEVITVNKDLTIQGPNIGTAGNGVRVAEAIISDGKISIPGANTVVFDGFKIYQTNTTTPVSLGGSAVATIQNCILERVSTTTGDPTRGIEISAGAGVKTIADNLFTGDVGGGVFSGHKTWNSGVYVNAAGSTISITGNTFEICRTALNIDDMSIGVSISGNTFANCGTYMAFGGTVATTGSYTLGANEYGSSVDALVNLSNVSATFRLDISAGTYNGTAFSALPLATLWQVESHMYHRTRSGRLGLAYYVANNQYVLSATNNNIQTAIDYAAAGDVINVQDGSYNQRLVVSKALTLAGESEAGAILDGTALGNGSGIYINNGITNVTIQDLTVQNFTGAGPNSYAGIYAIGGNDDLEVQNVTLKDNLGGSGFYANGPIDNVLLNNLDVSGHTNVAGAARGIVIWNGLKSNITITNSDVYNNNCCGIELQDGTATGVIMTGNNVYDNGDNGFGLSGMEGPGENLISGNTVTNNGRFGIEIKNPNGSGAATGAGRIVVENNNVSRTIPITDLRDIVGIAVFRRGVLAGNVDVPNGVVVQSNTVSGYVQGSTSDGFGIVIEGTNSSALNNTITGNDVGLQLQSGHLPYPGDGSQSNLADDYFGRGNSPVTCGITASGNTFSGNGIDERNVPSSLASAGVVLNTNTSTTFCSIQAAIDAATAGDSIYVSAGTYNEDLLINKALTLAGPNAGISAVSGTRVSEAILLQRIRIGATDDVTISGFEFFEVPAASNWTIYIQGNSNNFKFENNRFIDIEKDAIRSGISSATGNITVKGNLIDGITNTLSSGIFLGGTYGASLIADNKIDLANTGYSGIQTPSADGLTISGNEISNTTNQGIQLAGTCGNVTIENNSISNTNTSNGADKGAIRLYGTGFTGPITIQNNILTSSYNGVAIKNGEDLIGKDIIITNNNLSGNSNKAIYNGASAGEVDAPCNWFGTVDPAQVALANSGQVKFDPYLTNGTDDSGDFGFQPTPNSCSGCLGGLLVTNTNTGLPYCSIQAAIDDPLTLAGHTITVGAGTYLEDVLINKANLTILGAGIDQSIIDHSGQSGHNNAGVNITANGVTLKGFTVIDNDGGSVPRYGLKVGTSSVTTDDITLDSVKVANSYRTGFDLARPKNITLRNVFAIDNGGAGVFMSNPEGASIESITTSGNPWTGVSISSRSDWPGDATGVVFSGTNSFGENGGKNGGVQIESDNTLPISWGSDIADGKDVTIQQNELGYVMSGPTTNAFGSITYDPYFRFYQTLAQAQSAAGMGPDHIDRPRYIQDAFCSATPDSTNFYVYDFADTAMTIQAAVDAAVNGNTVNVDGGEYIEQVEITKDISLIGQGKGVTTVKGFANMPLSFTTSAANVPVIYGHGADIKISDLTVDGDGQGNTNHRYMGIGFSDAGGVINNVEVKAVRHTPLNGAQGGIGIFADASSGNPRNLMVTNTMVYDFQKNGMSLSGADLDATVDNNMVTGAGSIGVPLPAQNGIQFYGTNGGSITNNTVSAINYTPTSYIATGILVYFGSDTIKVTGNTLDSVEVGVLGYDNNTIVNNNTMDGGDYGIYGYSGVAGSVNAANNFISNYDFGVLMQSGGTLVSEVHENSITSFDTAAVVGVGTADSVEAQCNWYGTVDPAAITAAVSGQVKFQNYLTDGTDNSGDLGFQPVPGSCNGSLCPSVLYVNDGATANDVYTTAVGNDSNPGTASSPFATIQAAVDRACAGAIIYVDAGIYNENVNINKVLSVIGVDTSLTIIQGSGGSAVTMVAGASATERTTLAQLRVTGGASGITVNSHNTLTNVLSRGNTSYGVNLRGLNDLVITNSCFTHNAVGLKIPSTFSVTNLTIDGSEFSYNTQHGWYSDANKNAEPSLDSVMITNTSFSYNGYKGMYTERLSNALFENVQVVNSGNQITGSTAGIDLNLKWKDYENITFKNTTVSGSGTGSSNGKGIGVSARNDGGTYGAKPASISNLIFDSNTIGSPGIVGTDTLSGLAIGNAISNISFIGTNIFNGSGNGLTNFIDGGAMTDFSLGMSSFDGGLAHYVKNLSVVEIDALATLFDGKIGNDMTAGELTYTEDRIYHELDTTILGLVHYFDNCADGSCDGCYTAESFNDSVTTGSAQASGVWYTDRYAPDSFYVAADSSLVHLIDAADGASSRPGAFSSPFYNTQGRKYDLDTTTKMISIDLYVPAAWASTGRRMAGLWGTAFKVEDTISAYPILEFTSDNGDPRFQFWNGLGFDNLGLPCDFSYDAWHTLRIELLPTGEFRFSVDELRVTSSTFGSASAYIGNTILQGYNTTTGVSYQINWDNFVNGRGPEINYDATGPDPIVIGSGISNQHMAVGEFCGLNASLKAHKRFLGDVVPESGNTYQFGTGVSPTDGSNTSPDPGTARWNYLVSVNLGTFTFNDLNVYLDIDFDNSDSACQVGPYTADLSAFMISNGQGATSFFQDSQNPGFAFWQGIGDPNILPFDPYAEGTYDIAVRIENKDGVELMHVPIVVEVGCEFVEPSEDLEPPMLVCVPDTTIDSGQSLSPAITGMATVTGTCPQNITYGDDESGLTGCNGTGTIVRTWYNEDSTQTCTQNILVEDNTSPVLSACPSDTVLFATGPAGASLVFDAPTATEGFFEGFESAVPPADAWLPYNNNIVRVASGTDGIASKTGGYHASIDPSDAAQSGVFTRLGGYSSSFGNGFIASQDIYIDLSDTNVVNDTYGWDLSVAANNQSGNGRRDFIFHAASNASGNVLIAGSNNTNFTRRNDLAGLNNHEITSSGWYTFEWVFRDSAGVLAVDLNLKDSGGSSLFTETRYTASDSIATIVGGNRYMWFTFLETSDLRIDNTTLNRNASVICSASSGDTFPYGVTTVTCITTDACGNADSCSFNVSVVDTAGAINFDGVDDVVSVPHDASLSGFGTALTVEAWIRPEKVTGRQGIVGKWNDLGATNRRSMLLWATNDDVQFYVSSTGGDFPSAISTNKLTIGKWTHIAGTYDGQTIRLYVDGVLSATESFSGSMFNNTVDPLLIGAVDGGGTSRQHFDGDIDEVRLYNRVLCADEILAHMNCELSGLESGLNAYYNFNQGVAGGDNAGLDSLIDGSSNGNNGQLQNMALDGFASNWSLQADSVNGSCAPHLSPMLMVYGNNLAIADGDLSADVADSTDFGTVTLGGSNENCFYLVNEGTDVLNLSTASITGVDAAEFNIVPAFAGGSLSPGDSALVCVTYSPSMALAHSAIVEITSDNCLAPTYDFSIAGEGYEEMCDTLRFISDTTWRMSTTITPSSYSGSWSGVNGVLPSGSTFTDAVMLGQPYGYSYATLFAVDSAEIIKADNNIRYYRKSIVLDTLVDVNTKLRATFDDQVEVYINGKLLAAHYGFSNQNGRLPYFEAVFNSDGTVDNGIGGKKAFGFATSDTMENVFQPGVNEVVVVLRNLAKPGDAGGFSLSMEIDGCQGTIAPPDTVSPPINTACDTLGIVANGKWMMSTTVTPSSYSGSWSGVSASLPDTSTFTQPVSLGQPFSWQTIFPVDSSNVIKVGNDIRYFHRVMTLDSLVDIGAHLRATFDDQMEVYVNGKLLAGHYGFSNQNSKLPPFDAQFNNGGGVVNGVGGNKAFGFLASDTLDDIFKPGVNDVIVVLRNLTNSGDVGGFSINLLVNGCKGEIIPDTTVIPPGDTLTTSIVSDNGWEKSTMEEPSNYSGDWSGASFLPDSATYTLPAIEGQPYGYATIDPIDSAKVIKTGNDITFFRREFKLTDNAGLDTRFRMNVDDAMEIYINGKLVARENHSGAASFKSPYHDLKFFGGTAPVNGFNGGDMFDVVTPGSLDTFFVTGTNEVVLAVRNKGKATDAGGFVFRMDIDKGGNKVIVKTAKATSGAVSKTSVLDFELYPNPTTGLVNLELIGNFISDDNEIIVQDISGRVIKRGSFESFASDSGMQIDMSEFAAGVYLIRVKSGDTYRAKRVMKN